MCRDSCFNLSRGLLRDACLNNALKRAELTKGHLSCTKSHFTLSRFALIAGTALIQLAKLSLKIGMHTSQRGNLWTHRDRFGRSKSRISKKELYCGKPLTRVYAIDLSRELPPKRNKTPKLWKCENPKRSKFWYMPRLPVRKYVSGVWIKYYNYKLDFVWLDM